MSRVDPHGPPHPDPLPNTESVLGERVKLATLTQGGAGDPRLPWATTRCPVGAL